jgi:hypothetical protein
VLRLPLLAMQGVLAALALVSGAQLLATGAGLAAVPGAALPPDDIGLDAMLRFEGGVWAALGLALALCLHRIERRGPALRAAWGIVLLGGLAHCHAIRRFGYESPELLYSACMEVLAPLVLGTWQSFLARPAAGAQPPPRRAPAALQAAVGLCAALALYIGARAIYFGAPLPATMADQPGSVDLRGALHFVAGIWLGLGLVLAYAAADLPARGDVLRVACLILFCGGAGRLASLLRFGSHGPNVPIVIALELLLPVALCGWHYLSLREVRSAGPTPHPENQTPQRPMPAPR